MVKVKGNLLYHIKKIVISKYGEDKFNEILENTDEKTKECFKGAVISGDWYELELYENFLDKILIILGKQELEKIDYVLAETQFTGIFGFFLNLVTPEKVIKKSPFLFKKVFSEGELKIEEHTDNKLVISVSGIRFSESNFISFNGYVKAILIIAFKHENVTANPKKISEKEYIFEYLY